MEFFNIIIQIFFFLVLSCLPFSYVLNQKKILNNFKPIDYLSANFLILLNIILVFSFFNFDKEVLFLCLIILSVLSLIFLIIKKVKFYNNILFYSFLFIIFFVSVDIANTFSFDWDTKKYYLPRAYAFFQSLFVDDLIKHTERPYFSTYIWSFFWKNSLIQYEYFGRMIYGYLYVLSIFYFFDIKKIELKSKIILCLILILFTYKSSLFTGNPDILMFSLFMFLAKELYKIFSDDISNNNLITLSLILNLMIWFKSEGMVYSIITFISVLFFLKNNNKFKILLFLSITTFLTIKILFYNYWGLSLNPNQSLFSSNFLNLLSFNLILERSLLVCLWYLTYFFTNPIVIFILFFVVYLFFNHRTRIKSLNFIICFFLIKFLAIYFSSIISTYELTLNFHLKYTVDRVIFQSSGLLLIILLQNYDILKKFFNFKLK